jgi:hypothetical protein
MTNNKKRVKEPKYVISYDKNNYKNSVNGMEIGTAIIIKFSTVYVNKFGNIIQSLVLRLAIGVAIGVIFTV